MKRSQSAFSLLEIVFASFIFAGLVTVMSAIWVLHARAQAKSTYAAVAADLADLEMNRALAQGFHDVSPANGTFTQTWQTRGQTIEHVYTSQVAVYEVDVDGVDEKLKLIRVKVSYDDGSGTGKTRSFSVDSMMADES